MVTTEHLPALTSKAQCVDYTRFQVACQHVITIKYDTPSSHDGLLSKLCFFLFLVLSQTFDTDLEAEKITLCPSSQSWEEFCRDHMNTGCCLDHSLFRLAHPRSPGLRYTPETD